MLAIKAMVNRAKDWNDLSPVYDLLDKIGRSDYRSEVRLMCVVVSRAKCPASSLSKHRYFQRRLEEKTLDAHLDGIHDHEVKAFFDSIPSGVDHRESKTLLLLKYVTVDGIANMNRDW